MVKEIPLYWKSHIHVKKLLTERILLVWWYIFFGWFLVSISWICALSFSFLRDVDRREMNYILLWRYCCICQHLRHLGLHFHIDMNVNVDLNPNPFEVCKCTVCHFRCSFTVTMLLPKYSMSCIIKWFKLHLIFTGIIVFGLFFLLLIIAVAFHPFSLLPTCMFNALRFPPFLVSSAGPLSNS